MGSNLNILIVEDDQTIATGLEYALQQVGYETILCLDVTSAKQTIESKLTEINFCLLDVSLPDGSGYQLCDIIKKKRDIPVIFLTALDDEVNVVMGLDMGADDYITKPFRIRELQSRIKSVLRRYNKQSLHDKNVAIGNVRIQPLSGKVFKDDVEVGLTALEYRLLMVFVHHQGQILSRMQLLDLIWDVAGDFVNDNTLTVYIKRLRGKLEDDPKNPGLIQTVRGLGYKLGE